jgi:spore maturation protein CgeB
MSRPLTLVILGLTLSSSWGNGHATTWRALLRGMRAEGHRVLFLERDVPWYESNRDLREPEFCTLEFYADIADLKRYRRAIREADAVVVGSYVPDGVAVIDLVAGIGPRMLCFYDIDTPLTLAQLGRGVEEYVARRQLPEFDAYFSFAGGPVLDRLSGGYGVRRPSALHCSVDIDRYFPTDERPEWDLGYLGTYSDDRQPALERLLIEPARALADRRFVVAGPGYPTDIAWPPNVERIDHLPPDQHRSFYNRQRYTLNLTRADMAAIGWSPSVRLFEAAACGTPIVSDRWPGLESVFAERGALKIADTGADVCALLSQGSESERREQARAALKAVLGSHTGRVRARELANALEAVREDKSRAGSLRGRMAWRATVGQLQASEPMEKR